MKSTYHGYQSIPHYENNCSNIVPVIVIHVQNLKIFEIHVYNHYYFFKSVLMCFDTPFIHFLYNIILVLMLSFYY